MFDQELIFVWIKNYYIYIQVSFSMHSFSVVCQLLQQLYLEMFVHLP